MHERSPSSSPPSTHASVHLLVGPDSLPRVSANAVRGAQLAIDETIFLHVEAEHRTFSFDHTATFTVSGPRGAIDRLLLLLRAAVASIPPSNPTGEAGDRGADPDAHGPADPAGPGPAGHGATRMTRTLLVRLITLGDPERLSGGYLYHRRLAQLAPEHGAELRFVSVPEWPFPLPALAGGAVLRRALGPVAAPAADVVVLDSIAAGFLGPWLALRRPPVPLVGSLHQPPGGIDHGRVRRAVQAPLDRLAYRRAALLLVASQALAEQVETAGLLASRIRVVPPGRDVAAAPGAPAGDLRAGRRAALLCVANWVERKGILETLEALARLDACAATLHLAGDDRADPRYAAAVRARLSRRDLAGRVVVHGPLPVEAMAAGLPVVGWRAGNLPYLADEREAVLVPPGDVEGLSRALDLLAGDEPLRRRLGEASRRRARQRPTWRETAGSFFGWLREAAEGGRR